MRSHSGNVLFMEILVAQYDVIPTLVSHLLKIPYFFIYIKLTQW